MQIRKSFEISAQSLLRALLIFSAFAPLAVYPPSLFPTVFGKVAFVRILATAAAVTAAYMVFRGGAAWLSGAALRLRRALASPIVWAIGAFILSALASTLFAISPYRAFFGNVERGEGTLQLLYAAAFVPLALFAFERKHNWLAFFKATLLVGAIVASDALIDFFRVHTRPNGTFVGNPAFLSAYLLFVAFAAFVVLSSSPAKLWRAFGYATLAVSFGAFVAANTRGAFAGLIAGAVAAGIFLAARGKGRHPVSSARITWRGIGAAILIAISLFIGVFVPTRGSALWSRVPVLDRLSKISLEDATVRSRLRSFYIVRDAMDPSRVGAARFLLGYGPEHYIYVFNAHYDPGVQATAEIRQFDRAHNKLLDVFVMQGLIGLIAYLAIWGAIVRAGLRVKDAGGAPSLLGGPILFFATAYVVQDLFVFDHPTMHIPLFLFFGYVISLGVTKDAEEEAAYGMSGVSSRALFAKAGTLFAAAALAMGLVWTVLIPGYQMRKLLKTLESGYLVNTYEALPLIVSPYTYAQEEIRISLIKAASRLAHVEATRPFLERVIELGKETLQREIVIEPEPYQAVALAYDGLSSMTGDTQYLKIAEGYYRQALSLAPQRQDQMFVLAMNLVRQGKFTEATELARGILAVNPSSDIGIFLSSVVLAPQGGDIGVQAQSSLERLFLERIVLSGAQESIIRDGYNSYLAYYFSARDSDGFLKTLERALAIEKTLDRIREAQLAAGLINPADSQTDEIQSVIQNFQQSGWAAVQ